jgi:hypothetical protein
MTKVFQIFPVFFFFFFFFFHSFFKYNMPHAAKASFKIVVAASAGGGIGARGTIPWDLPGDLRHFSRVTRGLAPFPPATPRFRGRLGTGEAAGPADPAPEADAEECVPVPDQNEASGLFFGIQGVDFNLGDGSTVSFSVLFFFRFVFPATKWRETLDCFFFFFFFFFF